MLIFFSLNKDCILIPGITWGEVESGGGVQHARNPGDAVDLRQTSSQTLSDQSVHLTLALTLALTLSPPFPAGLILEGTQGDIFGLSLHFLRLDVSCFKSAQDSAPVDPIGGGTAGNEVGAYSGTPFL